MIVLDSFVRLAFLHDEKGATDVRAALGAGPGRRRELVGDRLEDACRHPRLGPRRQLLAET